jgi:uncharacterized protein (DUF1778 family)
MSVQGGIGVGHALKKPAPARSVRINLRASATEKKLIRLGAQKRGENVSNFILKSACAEAELALADQQHFELPANKFAEFVSALNRPARVVPALKKLFSEPSILER